MALTTAQKLDVMLHAASADQGLVLDIRYTHLEGEAIGWIYEADGNETAGLLMNAAGFLYTGFALRDCLKAVPLSYIEVHMTNIDQREMRSVTASEANGMVTGLGVDSYVLAPAAMNILLKRDAKG